MAQSALHYNRGHFGTALALADGALRSSAGAAGDLRRLAQNLRCRVLTAMDRLDESLAAATEGIRSAQQDRHGRALQLLEASRARQLLYMGHLADAAAALEGRFSPDDAHLILSILDADCVVVLGRVALHTADRRQTERIADIARVMLSSGVPSVERHAAWLLALQARAGGNLAQARRWLTAMGEKEHLAMFPVPFLDPADDPQLVRIALASGDSELAESATAAAEQRAELNPGTACVLASAVHAGGLLTWDPAGWPGPSASWKPASGSSRWLLPSKTSPLPRSGPAAPTRPSPLSTAP
jgi:hypothetical protein